MTSDPWRVLSLMNRGVMILFPRRQLVPTHAFDVEDASSKES